MAHPRFWLLVLTYLMVLHFIIPRWVLCDQNSRHDGMLGLRFDWDFLLGTHYFFSDLLLWGKQIVLWVLKSSQQLEPTSVYDHEWAWKLVLLFQLTAWRNYHKRTWIRLTQLSHSQIPVPHKCSVVLGCWVLGYFTHTR